MGHRLQVGKPSRYITSHPGQLSLAIPPWVGAMSTSESWDVNRHTARCTSLVSVVWQCKLVSGWGLKKQRSAPLYGPHGSGRTLCFCFLCECESMACCLQVELTRPQRHHHHHHLTSEVIQALGLNDTARHPALTMYPSLYSPSYPLTCLTDHRLATDWGLHGSTLN